jgi:hypothetical protein
MKNHSILMEFTRCDTPKQRLSEARTIQNQFAGIVVEVVWFVIFLNNIHLYDDDYSGFLSTNFANSHENWFKIFRTTIYG